MIQSKISSPRKSEVLLSPRVGVMAIKILQNEEISGGEKNGWGKESVLPSIRE